MKRPFGVTASAVFALLGSLGFMTFFGLFSVTAFTSTDTPISPDAKAGFAVVVTLFDILGVWGIITSNGLFCLRNWARISTIVFSVFIAFVGLVGGPAMLFVPAPEGAAENFHTVLMVFAVVDGALGLLGVYWLYYFNRRAAQQLFRRTVAGESVGPLSISVIGWWTLVSGVVCLVGACSYIPVTVFEWNHNGPVGVVLHLLFASVVLYIAYGLLQLKPLARVLAFWLYGVSAVSSVAFYTAPGQDRVRALLRSTQYHQPPYAQLPVPTHLLITLIMIGVPLGFLVATKSSFERAAASPNADSP